MEIKGGVMEVKIKTLVTFLIILFSSSVLAQYPQMYFPLQVGNRWQYSEVPGNYSESKAIKDTLMPNGHTYTVVQGELFNGVFRQDSSYVLIYNSSTNGESIYYDFTHKAGDTLSLYINDEDTIITTVYEEGERLMFGQQRHYMSFLTKSTTSTMYGINSVTDSLGFTGYNGEVLAYGLSGAIINGKEYGIILSVDGKEKNLPILYELLQNYPNPFNPNATIEFQLNLPGNVSINVYDVLGNKIKTLLSEYINAGRHNVVFNGENLSSGIYFYTINVNGISETKSMVLQK